MENLESVIVSFSIFGSVVGVVFILARYNYMIKKVYAEKGVLSSIQKTSYTEVAWIIIGIAFGLGVSSVFTAMALPEETMELLIYATILMGGGLGLLAAQSHRNKREGK